MKRYILIGAAALALLFTGCSGGVFIDPGYDLANGGNGSGVNGGNSGGTSFNPNVDSKIVGKWESAEEDGYTWIMEFKANGTWYSSGGGQGQSGTFTAKNGVLTMSAEGIEEQKIPYKIEENGNKLTIIETNKDGEEHTAVLYKSGKNNSGGGDVSGSIVGKWKDIKTDEIAEFKSDWGFTITKDSNVTDTGTYTAKDDIVTINSSGETNGKWYYSITGNTLRLSLYGDESGYIIILYTRVQ